MPVFLVKSLDSSILMIYESNNDIAVFGILSSFDYNNITVEDTCIYHTFATYFQGEKLLLIYSLHLKSNVARDIFNGCDRLTCGDSSHYRNGSSSAVREAECG